MREEPGWGGWVLGGGYLLFGDYDIPVASLTDPAQLLDWLCQIKGKNWATDEALAGLVRAFDDILHPQTNMCSWGIGRKIDPFEVIAMDEGK